MTATIPIAQQRDELAAELKSFVKRVQAEGRDMTDRELDRVQQDLDRIAEWDKAIARSKQAAEQRAVLDEMTSKPFDGFDPITGDDRTGYLSLSTSTARESISRHIARKMADFAGIVGSKALVPTGEITSPLPLLPADPVEMARPAPGLLDVLAATTIAQGARATFLQQVTRTNNAAPVAVGDPKPVSVIGLEGRDVALSVYAHLSEPVDRFLLEDATQLARFVSSELLWGLGQAVESDVINGNPDPGDPGITGILATSGIQTVSPGSDILATLRSALTRLQVQGLDQGLVYVLHPSDFEAAETFRSEGSGEYDFASAPVDSAARRIWGVSVVLSNALTAGTGLLLNRTALGLYVDRQGVRTDVGAPGDLWARNEIQFRCEGRFDLAVLRPVGCVRITLAVTP